MSKAIENAVDEKNKDLKELVKREYKEGFVTEIESNTFEPGLNEDVIRRISAKKDEPDFMLEYRLKAFKIWQKMREPDWAHIDYPKIDFQEIAYFSEPKQKPLLDSLDDVDPKLLETYERLGIPLEEQKMLANVAVDAVFDSVSVRTTFRETLSKAGVIFMPISEALQEHPELVKQYLGSVVPIQDNYYAALNAAVFSDGSFVYIPKGCLLYTSPSPRDLSTSRMPSSA